MHAVRIKSLHGVGFYLCNIAIITGRQIRSKTKAQKRKRNTNINNIIFIKMYIITDMICVF